MGKKVVSKYFYYSSYLIMDSALDNVKNWSSLEGQKGVFQFIIIMFIR